MEKRGHDEKSVPEMLARRGVFFDGTNEVGGRTDDAVFPVRGVRESVEGELMIVYRLLDKLDSSTRAGANI